MTMLLTLALFLAPGDGGTIATLAGTGNAGYGGDGGPAKSAQLNNPFDCALDAAGNLYFSDTNNHCVRKVDAKGTISTVAGSGKKGYSGDNGPAVKATMNEPYGVALDKMGNLFVVDRLNACVRRVDAKSGVITTIAGTGVKGFSGDHGPGDKAKLKEPNGIALAERERFLFIADVGDQRLRILDLKSGIIETYCGNGTKVHGGDGGPVGQATLYGPRAVAVTHNWDRTYIVEREGHCVRNIIGAKINTFAGTGEKGYSGDGGPANKAKFNGPKEIELDAAGNVFVVDTENDAIRRIDGMTGIITTVAGGKKVGDLGDGGPATAARLARPHGVAVGADGTLYIADTLNHRIRIVK